MALSKETYELVADTIRHTIEAAQDEARAQSITKMGTEEWHRRTTQIEGMIELANNLRDVFAGDNERFDPERFEVAAGLRF